MSGQTFSSRANWTRVPPICERRAENNEVLVDATVAATPKADKPEF